MTHVTDSPNGAPAQFLAFSHTSLMHGWVPMTVQVLAGVVLTLAVGWRSRRWRTVWVPAAALAGAAVAYLTHWYIVDRGLSDEPAPAALWLWVMLTGTAVAVLVLGWRTARRWRRGAAVLAVPLCLLSAALVLNLWVGYFPTVQSAWSQLTSGPLPDQTDQATVTAMAASRIRPPHGTVVPVAIPSDGSHFKHRGELVYLPPEWFATTPPPALPTVMMIGGQFNTPADWTRAGNAVKTIDDFAAAHHGQAPVLVFVDSGGAFNNDTECVNGVRGNAADHLTKDVVPFMISAFGVSPHRSNWGVAGWSMGGTCAVDLTVMHPELFSAFVDVAGDFFPNAGNKAQTIARLFGGNADAWAAFDPTTVINRHGPYRDVAGWFAISSDGPPAPRRDIQLSDSGAIRLAAREAAANPGNQTAAAYSLCALGRANGIDCAVVPQPGRHDWPFADRAFAAALPWLAGALGTPESREPRCPPRRPRPSALRWWSRPSGPTPASDSAGGVGCARAACGLRAALPPVQRVVPMGEHAADPGAALDATGQARGMDCAVAGGESVHLRRTGPSPRLGHTGDAGRGTVDHPPARDAAMVVSAATSAAALVAVIAAHRHRLRPALVATALQMALTLVYWQQMVRYLEREMR